MSIIRETFDATKIQRKNLETNLSDNTNVSSVNGHNGNVRTISTTLTKPAIVSSNGESTNGNGGILPTEKRAPIVLRFPKWAASSNRVILHY